MKSILCYAGALSAAMVMLSSCESDDAPKNENYDGLMINEVYAWGTEEDVENLDYIELYNASDREISLKGLQIWEAGGQEEAFQITKKTSIASKGYFTLECDKSLVDSDTYAAYGLSKNGDEITLADSEGNVLDYIEVPGTADGEAYGRLTDGADEWVIFAERSKNGTNNDTPQRSGLERDVKLFINEVFTNDQKEDATNEDNAADWIELYNGGTSNLDISGYVVYDDKKEDPFVIAEGTVLAPGNFYVIDVDKNNTDGTKAVFGLGKGGDRIYLFTALETEGGELIDELETPRFADLDLYSTGRKTDGAYGEEDSEVILKAITKGGSNNGTDYFLRSEYIIEK
ncbi:lamin tail domain-containing protein [Formosa sp. S-31]|uniref:lamin tail domain-containing protein n=1 Tax=Formosa sp. S-31 TaxID=2790949 RepID=UPI003EB7620F